MDSNHLFCPDESTHYREKSHNCTPDSPSNPRFSPTEFSRAMAQIIPHLVVVIYSDLRLGRTLPVRLEFGPDRFRGFQLEHREALAALLPEADNLYPGSLVGVPVVELSALGAVLVLLDGGRVALPLPE